MQVFFNMLFSYLSQTAFQKLLLDTDANGSTNCYSLSNYLNAYPPYSLDSQSSISRREYRESTYRNA